MKNNILVKVLCSLPIILIGLYFSRFLGICLIIFRLIAFKNKTKVSPYLILIGLILLIPKLLGNINLNIPYLEDVLVSSQYASLLSYSKFLIIFGVILLMIEYLVYNVKNSLNSKLKQFSNKVEQKIEKDEQMHREIAKENDYKMKLRKEEVENTRLVSCPSCGAENLLKNGVGRCKYCRNPLK